MACIEGKNGPISLEADRNKLNIKVPKILPLFCEKYDLYQIFRFLYNTRNIKLA
jgi:hypothetical protein